MINGECQTFGQGFPLITIQEEEQAPAEREDFRRVVKVHQLVRDLEVPDLLSISVYDTKYVDMLSMYYEIFLWVKKTSNIFDKSLNKVKDHTFNDITIKK